MMGSHLDYLQVIYDGESSLENDSDAGNEVAATAFIDNDKFECFCNTKKHELPQKT